MVDEQVRFFIAWDSTIPGIRSAIESAVDLRREPDVAFAALGYRKNVPAVGSLRSRMVQEIQLCQGVIAAVDRPNATVGWEIGYCLARGLSLALIRAGTTDLPEWTRFGLLRGQLSTPATLTSDRFVEVARQFAHFTPPPDRVAPGGRGLLLCPRQGTGTDLGRELRTVPGLDWLDPAGLTLDALPARLKDIGRVAWFIPDPSADQLRDGVETGMLGVVAGYLEGSGVQVELFVHEDARDQQHMECQKPFDSISEAVEQLLRWEARTRLTPTGEPPPPPAPLVAWREDCLRQHSELLPFVSRRLHHQLLNSQPVLLHLEADATLACLPERAAGVVSRLHGRVPLRTLISSHLAATSATEHAGRWLIVAEPGAGKSTLARHLAWSLASEADGDIIPVYVPLAELTRAGLDHPFTWAGEVLHADDGRIAASDLTEDLFRASEQRGQVWLLLDGLDEVVAGKLEQTRQRIGVWAEAMPRVVIVVLCRPTAADAERPPPGGFRAAAVAPLERPDQLELAGHLLSAAQVERLDREVLAQPRIRLLASNPLLLTLVAKVAERAWEIGGDAPRHRLELYEQAVELFLERGWGESGVQVRDRGHARHVLEELSLHLQGQGEGEAWREAELRGALDTLRQADTTVNYMVRETWGSNDGWLKDIDQHAGLLGQRDSSRAPWRYLHRSFCEYLAACALERRESGERLGLLEGVGRREHSQVAARWAEVLGMLCGMVPGPEGEAYLDQMREQAPEVALRALPAMDHLRPLRRVEILAGLDWQEDTLEAVAAGLSAWGEAGLRELEGAVLDRGRSSLDRRIAAMLLPEERRRVVLEQLGPSAAELVADGEGLGWLAARLCTQLRGLEPAPWLDLLLALGWEADADDWDDLLDAMGPAGVAALWAEVRPKQPLSRLSVLWYALERQETAGQGWRAAAWPDLRRRFLAAAGMDAPPELDWVSIPAGHFEMGSPEGEGHEWERPPHPVRFGHSFQMSKTTVTQAQAAGFVGEGEGKGKGKGKGSLPLTNVDWFSARLMAAWLGGRLPTEAEWEYACRAGGTGRYCNGEQEEDLARVGWFDRNSGNKVHPVGQKETNAWGLHDMHGNVWEWCEDRFGDYPEGEAADPAGPARGPCRVLRGGSFWDGAVGCRSATRYWDRPAYRFDFIGFRVVLVAPPPAGTLDA